MKAYFLLSFQTLHAIFVGPFRGEGVRLGHLFAQLVRLGVRALPMASLMVLTIGIVLAMQGAALLEKMGVEFFVPDLVAAGLLKELAPLIVAIIIIGRNGSAVTAELGTMKVSEEIEALDVMAINPVGFLVAPRVLALLIMTPVLTVLGIYIGMFGGWLVCITDLDISTATFINRGIEAVYLKDLGSALTKSVVFGALIGTIACHYGVTVRGGADGVGKSTTASVVVSLLAVFIANALITALFFKIDK